MPVFEVVTLEKWEHAVTYYVEAETPERAEEVVRLGEISYASETTWRDESTPEDIVYIMGTQELEEGTYDPEDIANL